MSASDPMRLVRSKCPKCLQVDEFKVPERGLRLRGQGLTIDAAFPTLSWDRRVQLKTHVCPTCQASEKVG